MTAPHTPTHRVASVDIGSNSVILLIAERDADGRWKPRLDEAHITRISQGMDASGTLAGAPVERTAAVLDQLAARCGEHGVARIHATGTAPFRRARNGAAVARQLGERLGAEIRIVSGDEEAELSLLATQRAFPDLGRCMIVDIGGASTELIGVDGDAPSTNSIDLGSVRLTERFQAQEALPPERREAIRKCVEEALDTQGLRPTLARWAGAPLIGIAGTVTTLLAASLGQQEWQAEAIHGGVLSRQAIDGLADQLCALDHHQRAELPGIPPGRADVIAAGALLLTALMEALQAPELRVSDRGVRWGRLHREEDP